LNRKELNKKPNVVFILSDDQGIWALGCYGNKEIKTPNLDRLAASGIRFNNFYCVSPVCSPARASILTGEIPSQHGIHDYLSDGNGGQNQSAIEYLKGHRGYTEILAENGYQCGLSGKWHLGNSRVPQKGFTFWYVHQKGGGPYYNAPMIRDGELVEEPGYITDVITDEAINFINTHAGLEEPFYLSVNYTAPHSPWVDCHPEEYLKMYEDCSFESCPQKAPHPWALVDALPGYKKPKENLQGYFAAVTAMDQNIGRLLDLLEEKNLTENTLICFMSDNGFNCGHHGIWGKGNGTFPLNMYDSSVKVPFIMSHKGYLPENQVCETMLSAYDFMPTLLDYLGFENPDSGRLPGHSFVSLLLGGESVGLPVVVFDEYGPVRMIRSREYKYVHRYPYGPDELYNLEKDPDEDVNLINAAEYKGIVIELRKALEQWFYRYVNPEIDGAREEVLGGGQKGMAGLKGSGAFVYSPNWKQIKKQMTEQ